MRCKKKSWRGSKNWRQTSMTRGNRSWFQDLINVWTMPATMLKNKVMYRQFIHSVAFVNLKCCTCLKDLCIPTFRTHLVFFCLTDKRRPKTSPDPLPALRRTPRVGNLQLSMKETRQTIVMIITFGWSNKKWLEIQALGYIPSRKKCPIHPYHR